MSNGIKVKKRNGRGTEALNLEKMHKMVEEATKGIAGVSASQVEIQSGIQFYDGITTAEIQEILIKSASDLIDLDHPNYQYVAARLLLFSIRKSLYGRSRDMPALENHIVTCVGKEVYDNEPRSKEITARISSTIAKGDSVVIWPTNIHEKDINDMVLAGHDVQSMVESNVYDGLKAKLQFNTWKRI